MTEALSIQQYLAAHKPSEQGALFKAVLEDQLAISKHRPVVDLILQITSAVAELRRHLPMAFTEQGMYTSVLVVISPRVATMHDFKALYQIGFADVRPPCQAVEAVQAFLNRQLQSYGTTPAAIGQMWRDYKTLFVNKPWNLCSHTFSVPASQHIIGRFNATAIVVWLRSKERDAILEELPRCSNCSDGTGKTPDVRDCACAPSPKRLFDFLDAARRGLDGTFLEFFTIFNAAARMQEPQSGASIEMLATFLEKYLSAPKEQDNVAEWCDVVHHLDTVAMPCRQREDRTLEVLAAHCRFGQDAPARTHSAHRITDALSTTSLSPLVGRVLDVAVKNMLGQKMKCDSRKLGVPRLLQHRDGQHNIVAVSFWSRYVIYFAKKTRLFKKLETTDSLLALLQALGTPQEFAASAVYEWLQLVADLRAYGNVPQLRALEEIKLAQLAQLQSDLVQKFEALFSEPVSKMPFASLEALAHRSPSLDAIEKLGVGRPNLEWGAILRRSIALWRRDYKSISHEEAFLGALKQGPFIPDLIHDFEELHGLSTLIDDPSSISPSAMTAKATAVKALVATFDVDSRRLFDHFVTNASKKAAGWKVGSFPVLCRG